jgi:hypothetical protein
MCKPFFILLLSLQSSVMFAQSSAHARQSSSSQSPALSQPSAHSGPYPSPKKIRTFCNPLDLPYNFQSPGPTRREAADPVIVLYHGKYWLFASKQIGYWWSDDLLTWRLVKPTGLPLEIYAPSVTVVDDRLCYTSGGDKGTFVTNDPARGTWSNLNPYKPGCADPDVFQDTDGKVWLVDGCSDKTPLRITELDRHTFLPLSGPVSTIAADTSRHGWEVSGDNNEEAKAPWIEGSWMNKIDGHYYWQYAAPGTQYDTYGDGVYVADRMTGPFVYQPYSPFSFKPTGFIAGAGHSATFADKAGEYWHISTGTISVRHMFERRLVLFPAGVLSGGQLVVNTYLGDYPQFAPGTAPDHLTGNSPRWMLVSYDKPATASSTSPSNPPSSQSASSPSFAPRNAFDENIRTWWSAASGNPGEWLQVDLTSLCRINAIQVNFADQGAQQQGPLTVDGYRYEVEVSRDNRLWQRVIDRREKGRDASHDYTQLGRPVFARYVRITNVHMPAGAFFSLSDLRIFGSGLKTSPPRVTTFSVHRDPADQRHAQVQWQPVPGADFYIVRYGLAPDRLFGNYQVYKTNTLDIRSLNVGTTYYFTIDAVNGTGITSGVRTISQ